ncbi:hypothetical protein RIF29_17306 [Crotalaria pallida]|uniref:4-coumarate--CoA ligase n=1 Tax=Crotalaria pallida TaxID=3830 RepID=A0AAN9FJ09_CROPI
MDHFQKFKANYVPLTPITFLTKAAKNYANRTSIIHEGTRFTWQQTYERCCRLAFSIRALDIARNHVVSVLAPNIPAMYEMHFAVPMAGAILNTINTRLDANNIATILRHSEAKVLFVDYEYVPKAREVLQLLMLEESELEYEQLVHKGDANFVPEEIQDEWAPIALNYTSGTTSAPKGVVYSHKSAYLSTLNNLLAWEMGGEPIYLWTLPMFHCNGWSYTWGVAARGGTDVCLRTTTAYDIYRNIAMHNVTHMCCAPIVFNIYHPRSQAKVLEAAVVAMPHPKWGESPCAFVALKKKGETNDNVIITEADVIGFCRKNMSHFMVPKVVKFVEELPKTSTGKVKKNELRDKAEAL